MKKLTGAILVIVMSTVLAGCYTKSCQQVTDEKDTVSYKAETK